MREQLERAPRRVRPATLLTVCLLAIAGCGSSSKGKSTASTPASSQAATSASGGSPTTASTATSTQPAAASVSSGATSRTVTVSAGGVAATMVAGTHTPRVNVAWPLHFTVTRAGRPARASVEYEFTFAGAIVAHRAHNTFTGHFSDVFQWPASAVGYPLTFRAVIVSGPSTLNLDYPVQVRR